MNTIIKPLNLFIKEQIDLGIVKNEIELEKAIVSEIKKRQFDRKIFKSNQKNIKIPLCEKNNIDKNIIIGLEQSKKGLGSNFDKNYIDNLINNIGKNNL